MRFDIWCWRLRRINLDRGVDGKLRGLRSSFRFWVFWKGIKMELVVFKWVIKVNFLVLGDLEN